MHKVKVNQDDVDKYYFYRFYIVRTELGVAKVIGFSSMVHRQFFLLLFSPVILGTRVKHIEMEDVSNISG